MRSIVIYFKLLLLPLVVLAISCHKASNTTPSTSTQKSFSLLSLKADQDTIKQGSVTNVKATLSGTANLKWASSAGDLFGSGTTVMFGASTCCTGTHVITCTANDGNNFSETMTVSVYVR